MPEFDQADFTFIIACVVGAFVISVWFVALLMGLAFVYGYEGTEYAQSRRRR